MTAVQRYAVDGTPDPEGPAVLFADVEEALKHGPRLEWLLPLVDGSDGPEADARTAALMAAILTGKKGIEAVDEAMRIRGGA